MTNSAQGVQFNQCAAPKTGYPTIGESKSDYEIVLEVAKKMGKYEEVTEGKTVEDWIKYAYEGMGLPEFISWEELKKSNIMLSQCPGLGK